MKILRYIGLELWIIGTSIQISAAFVNDLTFDKTGAYIAGMLILALGILIFSIGEYLEDDDEQI